MTRIQPKPIQLPTAMPVGRYRAFEPVAVPDRTWPGNRITKAPRWLSTDLRDGNQALIDPMTPSRKMRMFELLVALGYKEIEVGFPSASQTDFDFVRQLITGGRVPEDVTISVLTQAREDLIARTAESLIGAHRATIHMYNATSELFRRVVFGIDEAQCINLATHGTELVIKYAEKHLGDVEFGYQYSPEIFTQTPTDFAIEVCNAVAEVWQPTGEREIIFNLPRPWSAPLPTPMLTRSSISAGMSGTGTLLRSRCIRTMTGALPPQPLSWGRWPERTGLRAACSGTENARETSIW